APSCALQAATFVSRPMQPPSGESTTALFSPVGAVKRTVTTCSGPVGSRAVESQGRSATSTVSPPAAYGRFVAPSAALYVNDVPGIRLHPAFARAGDSAFKTVTSAKTANHGRRRTKAMRGLLQSASDGLCESAQNA